MSAARMPHDGPAATFQPPLAAEPLLSGVSRRHLVERALEDIPVALHEELEDIALESQGRVVHHGLVMERVLWRARWRRGGWPPLCGPIAVHEGHIF